MIWWTLETLTIEPALLAEEAPDRLPRAQERAAQVDGEHAVEVRLDSSSIGREIWMPALLTRMSMPAEPLDGLADHAHDVVLAGDVAADQHVAHALVAHPATQACTCSSVSRASSGARR